MKLMWTLFDSQLSATFITLSYMLHHHSLRFYFISLISLNSFLDGVETPLRRDQLRSGKDKLFDHTFWILALLIRIMSLFGVI